MINWTSDPVSPVSVVMLWMDKSSFTLLFSFSRQIVCVMIFSPRPVLSVLLRGALKPPPLSWIRMIVLASSFWMKMESLFSPSFYPMSDLFFWQFLGEIFKICGWLLSYIMIAKAMVKTFVLTEVIFTVAYVLLSYNCILINGVVGIPKAYMINYIIYFLCMIVIYRKYIKSQRYNKHLDVQ